MINNIKFMKEKSIRINIVKFHKYKIFFFKHMLFRLKRKKFFFYLTLYLCHRFIFL